MCWQVSELYHPLVFLLHFENICFSVVMACLIVAYIMFQVLSLVAINVRNKIITISPLSLKLRLSYDAQTLVYSDFLLSSEYRKILLKCKTCICIFGMPWIFRAVNCDCVHASALFKLSVSISRHILLKTSTVRGCLLFKKKVFEELLCTAVNHSHFPRIPHRWSVPLTGRNPLENIWTSISW